jgi:SET domain-containing protein
MAYYEKWLKVKKSQIPNSGKGLFTTVDIKKGERIVEYKGRLHKWKDIKHQDHTNGYLLYMTSQAVIDGRPARSFGRYANDAAGLSRVAGLKNNAEYLYQGKRCFIESKRTIKAGEEIFVAYGREYWSDRRKELTKKKTLVKKKSR